jgi:hypothetical protein
MGVFYVSCSGYGFYMLVLLTNGIHLLVIDDIVTAEISVSYMSLM